MKEKKKDTYFVLIICTNCGWGDGVDIEKGKMISETPCPYCGCYTLKAEL